MSIEARLHELGLVLPEPAAPVASYVPFVRTGDLLHISGQIPFDAEGRLIVGRVGDDMDVAAGQNAARRCALGIIAQTKAALGTLDSVARIIKLGIFVNCTADFTEQPEVANGASDLMLDLFGDNGKHARAAVGVPSLPRGVAVEVDAIILIR